MKRNQYTSGLTYYNLTHLMNSKEHIQVQYLSDNHEINNMYAIIYAKH